MAESSLRRAFLAALVGGALCWTAQPPLAAQHAAHSVARAAAPALRVAANPSMVMTAPITRDGAAPAGPDPYKLVRDDLEYIKASIKQMLSSNKGEGAAMAKNEVLTMAAREFSQRKGKSFRPMLVLLVGALPAAHPRSAWPTSFPDTTPGAPGTRPARGPSHPAFRPARAQAARRAPTS